MVEVILFTSTTTRNSEQQLLLASNPPWEIINTLEVYIYPLLREVLKKRWFFIKLAQTPPPPK